MAPGLNAIMSKWTKIFEFSSIPAIDEQRKYARQNGRPEHHLLSSSEGIKHWNDIGGFNDEGFKHFIVIGSILYPVHEKYLTVATEI